MNYLDFAESVLVGDVSTYFLVKLPFFLISVIIKSKMCAHDCYGVFLLHIFINIFDAHTFNLTLRKI